MITGIIQFSNTNIIDFLTTRSTLRSISFNFVQITFIKSSFCSDRNCMSILGRKINFKIFILNIVIPKKYLRCSVDYEFGNRYLLPNIWKESITNWNLSITIEKISITIEKISITKYFLRKKIQIFEFFFLKAHLNEF